jgi:hypothetical protein
VIDQPRGQRRPATTGNEQRFSCNLPNERGFKKMNMSNYERLIILNEQILKKGFSRVIAAIEVFFLDKIITRSSSIVVPKKKPTL